MRRDLWPGAGWGVIDSLERPKAPFYALRRAFAPRTVLITDEGLSGLWLHLFNDGPERLAGKIRLRVFDDGGVELETAEREIGLDPHGALELGAESLLDGFRDLGNAYRFAPRVYDVVLAELCDDRGVVLARAFHLVDGPARPRLAEIGLAAEATRTTDGGWSLTVSSTLFAQYVCIEVPGWRPADSWFHIAPGERMTVPLHGGETVQRPSGSIRALNCSRPVHISLKEEVA
jgi:beta-mannosidase